MVRVNIEDVILVVVKQRNQPSFKSVRLGIIAAMTDQFNASAEFAHCDNRQENRRWFRRHAVEKVTHAGVGSRSLATLAHDISIN
jgi:hypothetical protein